MARSPASAESLVEQIRPYIRDERVLAAVAAVPRHLFVPEALSRFAWENTALPIGAGQTISQPVVVARMCELLQLTGDEKVLDVGTGSGYHAAVLAHLARVVWSIERKPELAEQARHNLAAAGIENVHVVVGDGSRGLPEQAPFDAINVAAAAHDVPAALERAARRRRPAGRTDRRARAAAAAGAPHGDMLERTYLDPVRFVPLVADAELETRRRKPRRRASGFLQVGPAAPLRYARARRRPVRRRARRPGLGVGVRVRVDLAGALVELRGALALHLRALRALLGLCRLTARPRGLLLGAGLLALGARVVQARLAAMAVGLVAQALGAPHAAPLRSERHDRKHHDGGDDQQDHCSGSHTAPSLVCCKNRSPPRVP